MQVDEDELAAAPRPDRLVGRHKAAAAAAATGDSDAPGQVGARATGLGGGAGVYRPPKLNPVSMDL